MGLYKFFRVSKPSADKVPAGQVDAVYKQLRRRTFWGATAAYSLYYVCRLAFSVVKQPLIDDGILTAEQLGTIGSVFLMVYAFGKFANGFVADYCNIRRFMAVGLLGSSLLNLLLAVLGYANSALAIPAFVIMISFAVLWGLNGFFQSMGSAPGVISLSRWFPLKTRGTWYSIFSASPYIGEALAFVLLGFLAKHVGWQSCFLVSAVLGVIGAVIAMVFITDTPQSKGLPAITVQSGEGVEEKQKTSALQKRVFRNPGIWVIALSSGFVYITKYAVSGWGVLFLQKAKDFPLEGASVVTAVYAVFGLLGTVLAGWLSDRVFKGRRMLPVAISGVVAFLSLAGFLFLKGGYVFNIICVSLFSASVGVLYCITAGIIALDLVPRKATGAAIGIIGIVCYVFAAVQDLLSGYLIGNFTTDGAYDFFPVSVFWLASAALSFLIPLIFRKRLTVK